MPKAIVFNLEFWIAVCSKLNITQILSDIQELILLSGCSELSFIFSLTKIYKCEGGITGDCFGSQFNGTCKYMLVVVFILNPHLSISLFYGTLNFMNYQLHSFSNVLHSHTFGRCFYQMLYSSEYLEYHKLYPSFSPQLVFNLKILFFLQKRPLQIFAMQFH